VRLGGLPVYESTAPHLVEEIDRFQQDLDHWLVKYPRNPDFLPDTVVIEVPSGELLLVRDIRKK
jgi:hypothetical protein